MSRRFGGMVAADGAARKGVFRAVVRVETQKAACLRLSSGIGANEYRRNRAQGM